MARFDTTNWSVVLKAGSGDTTGCQEALARLCETYWYPVYAFIRRSGASAADAEDLTQEYFARFLEKRFLDGVRPERGRFRSFLLVSVRNFQHNERDRERALKRGGGRQPLPLHGEDGEVRYEREPADAVTPEVLFERAWVRAVLDRALERLQAQSEGELQADRFARLRPFLTGDGPDATYAEIAREWGVGGGGAGGARGRSPPATAVRGGAAGRGGEHGRGPAGRGGRDPPSPGRGWLVTDAPRSFSRGGGSPCPASPTRSRHAARAAGRD